ncbi:MULTISPECIES: carbohydrate kinase family protein [unclassified Streptomyces]|uniref:carbohydrate kinase family protein n=1 Tax=unclassified Streptomyces TaxID=2593676 RepID=UPI00278BAE0A|nr:MULTISPECIES: carbohydrate kinase family protein [unclassified Streptomyces]
MSFAVTGSVASDHLMTFPGRFTDQLLPDQLAHVSLSFLVDSLDVRHGGVAANIAYGLARLGHRPLLVGAVGADFERRGAELAALGVDMTAVRVSRTRHTARFMCTTDTSGNQLASFCTGAMAEAADIDLEGVLRGHGGVDLVHIGADDPDAMARHTRACRALGVPFAADPAQQLARLDGAAIRQLVDGARLLFTNGYERALLVKKTGWRERDVLERVGTWVTTRGAEGSVVERLGRPAVPVAAVAVADAMDPTGVGDAYRAGFLAATADGHDAVAAARHGSALAALALRHIGTQTYAPTAEDLDAVVVAAHGARAKASASAAGVSG